MSKRKSGGGGAAAPLSHYNDNGVRESWPVLIYRLQSHRGWEVFSDPDKEVAKTTNATKKKGGSGNDANAGGKNDASSSNIKAPVEEQLTAAPRAGCIEVRKMRLRISLFQQHRSWSDKNNAADNDGKENDGDDSDTPGADGWNNNSLLVRRRQSLLVTTRRGMGAVMFQFKSTQDCVDFCDRLVYLNREYLFPSPRDDAENTNTDYSTKKRARADNNESDGYVTGLDRRELHIDEMNGIKRHRGSAFGDYEVPEQRLLLNNNDPTQRREEGSGNLIWSEEEAPSMAEEATKQSRRQEEMMSYIVKLAHSEEFRGFVDEIERGLETAEDTAAIHAALGV